MAARRTPHHGQELRLRLRTAIRDRGVSVRRASLRAGLGAATLHNLLKETGRQPTTETCRLLAKFFGWPEADVLGWAGHLPAAEARRDPVAAITQALEDSDWGPLQRAWVLQVTQQAAAQHARHLARVGAGEGP